MNATRLSRRDLLKRSAATAAMLSAGGIITGCSQLEPDSAQKRTPHSFRLGLDTYSLHHTLTAKDPANRRDLFWLLDQLDELGLTGLQIDPSHFPGNDAATLERLEAAVGPERYYIEFGMGGWGGDRLRERIMLTARFGGRAVRTFVSNEHASQEDLAKWVKMAGPSLHEAAAIADEHNVDIAVENHGDFTSVQLVELLELADHPRVGACLDTGNSLFRKEDPLECAKRLAPWAMSMHLKDWFMRHAPDGTPIWTEARLGQGQVPIAEILRLVAAHRPDLYLAMENPPQPMANEAATVANEWEHLVATAKDARRILAALGRARGPS